MSSIINAGTLDKRVSVMELQEVSANRWEWKPIRKAWASIEEGTGKNLFSSVGIGARDAKLIMRAQPITEHNAIQWGERHLFLSAIIPQGRQHLEVSAAIVQPVRCKGGTFTTEVDTAKGNRPKRTPGPDIFFPGVLTEKYAGYTRDDTHAAAKTTYVLVTPKVIQLREGALVTVEDGPVPGVYDVQVCHRLDPCKNEYEMTWQRDV